MSNKLLEKYRNFSPAAKASFWFVFSNVMLRGISFITLPIFSRILTTAEYSVVSVFSSWENIISIFCTLTLWGGIFNIVLVKHSEERDKYISSFQGLATTLTILFFALTIVFIQPFCKFSKMSPFLMVCMYVQILSQTPFFLWQGKQRIDYKYKLIVLITVIMSVLNPILGYIAVTHTENKAEARILVGVILNLFIGLLFFIFNLSKGKTFFNKDIWKYAVTFNVVLIPHYLAQQVLAQSDRIMINNMCSSGDAGIYSVAYSFAMLLTLVTSGINSSFNPFIYKCIKSEKYEKLRKATTFLLFGIAAVTVAMICVIPDVFKLMLPESYYPAIWVIPPVAGAVFFQFLYPLFGSVEFYYEAKKYVTIASVFGAGINVVLNYFFIKLFGFIAAAYTTLFCYIMFSVFHYFAMRIVLKKQGNRERIYDMKTILLVSIILIGAIIGITILYNNSIARWCVIGFVIILTFLMRKKIIGFVKELKDKTKEEFVSDPLLLFSEELLEFA